MSEVDQFGEFMYHLRFPLVLIVAQLSGCSEELGPTRIATTRVVGTVTWAGKPLESGWVEFIPTDGTVGNLRSAPILPDGTYRVDRVAIGRMAIGLTNLSKLDSPNQATEFLSMLHGFGTPIRRMIAGGVETQLDIDLAAEALAFRTTKKVLSRPMNESSK